MARLSRSAPVHSFMPPRAPVIRPRRNSAQDPAELELPEPLSSAQEEEPVPRLPKVLSVYNSWSPGPLAILLRDSSPLQQLSPTSDGKSNSPHVDVHSNQGSHRDSSSSLASPASATSPEQIGRSFGGTLSSTPTIFSLLQGRSLNKVDSSQSRSNLSTHSKTQAGDAASNYDSDMDPVVMSRRESLDLQFDISLEDFPDDEEEAEETGFMYMPHHHHSLPHGNRAGQTSDPYQMKQLSHMQAAKWAQRGPGPNNTGHQF